MRTTEFQRDDEDVPVKTQLLATHAGEDGCLHMLRSALLVCSNL